MLTCVRKAVTSIVYSDDLHKYQKCFDLFKVYNADDNGARCMQPVSSPVSCLFHLQHEARKKYLVQA